VKDEKKSGRGASVVGRREAAFFAYDGASIVARAIDVGGCRRRFYAELDRAIERRRGVSFVAAARKNLAKSPMPPSPDSATSRP